MNLLAKSAFRPDAHDITDQQHPHEEFRVGRGAPEMTVKGFHKRSHPIHVEETGRYAATYGWQVFASPGQSRKRVALARIEFPSSRESSSSLRTKSGESGRLLHALQMTDPLGEAVLLSFASIEPSPPVQETGSAIS